MQLSGEALRIGVRDLNDRIALDRPMHGQLLRFVHTAILQRDETAFSASRASMEQRVARWLLMAQDRMRSEDIELTRRIEHHRACCMQLSSAAWHSCKNSKRHGLLCSMPPRQLMPSAPEKPSSHLRTLRAVCDVIIELLDGLQPEDSSSPDRLPEVG